MGNELSRIIFPFTGMVKGYVQQGTKDALERTSVHVEKQ